MFAGAVGALDSAIVDWAGVDGGGTGAGAGATDPVPCTWGDAAGAAGLCCVPFTGTVLAARSASSAADSLCFGGIPRCRCGGSSFGSRGTGRLTDDSGGALLSSAESFPGVFAPATGFGAAFSNVTFTA